jgi:hypothetical protein
MRELAGKRAFVAGSLEVDGTSHTATAPRR